MRLHSLDQANMKTLKYFFKTNEETKKHYCTNCNREIKDLKKGHTCE